MFPLSLKIDGYVPLFPKIPWKASEMYSLIYAFSKDLDQSAQSDYCVDIQWSKEWSGGLRYLWSMITYADLAEVPLGVHNVKSLQLLLITALGQKYFFKRNFSIEIKWGNYVKTSLPPFWKRVYPKRKEFAPLGSKFFPFTEDPFRKVFSVQ